ncbi:MAG: FAD-dependent oxidoreductase [Chloroflexota bacterium]|nr:FAD-dependent oxidoreductase [Chloroflexota bacterium]
MTSDDYLLVFKHTNFPEACIQVPAGTLEPGETAEAGVLREAYEESGNDYPKTPLKNATSLPSSPDAIIIGGGISGTAAAFFLTQAGLKSTIIERLPALAALTTARSMESVRAQFVEPETLLMMRESITFYEDFAENIGLSDVDIGLHQAGYLFLTTEAAGAERFRQRVRRQHAFGLTDVVLLTGEQIRQRFPFVSEKVVAGTFRPGDGWLAAHEAAFGFARSSGAKVLTGTVVSGILQESGRVTGVETDQGRIAAPVVIVAAGPYSGNVASLAGLDLPLTIVRRHRVTIGQHPLIPQDAPMVIDGDTGAHWRPESPGAALAWAQAHEPPGEPLDDVRANPMFVFDVMEGVYRLCPFWLEVAESLKRDQVFLLAGQYTVTPDHKPIIGPHPELAGLYVSAGYNGHGIMAAPGAARLLADLVTGKVNDSGNPFGVARLSALAGDSENHELML